VWLGGLTPPGQNENCWTWKLIEWAEEGGQIRASLGPFLERRLRECQAWVHRRAIPSRADKAVRAESIRGRFMEALVRSPDARSAEIRSGNSRVLWDARQARVTPEAVFQR